MSLAIVYSRASVGISAPLVTIETHLSKGFPSLQIVGLPEAAVKESKYRVRSAIINSCFEFPRQRITINLAPADLPKEGGRFDLAIALGILAASKQIPLEKLIDYEFSAELALSGEVRAVQGILPVVLGAQQAKRHLIVSKINAAEAALVKEVKVFAATHLLEVCAFLRGEQELAQCILPKSKLALSKLNLADVKGQPHAKRALEIAAAGKHSLLMVGPPGTGKTMLASRLPGLLPPLSEQQALEVATIASISNLGFKPEQWQQLPFRAPHHTMSSPALVGGGRPPRPGEISLAHQGVLFLDELPEFNRHVLDSLRQPLEAGQVTISRASYQAVFPAQFQLIAAMNPCPCGYAGSQKNICHCLRPQIQRYLAKLSGPLLDRMDMQVEVPALPAEVLSNNHKSEEESEIVKARVTTARLRQYDRQNKCNAELAGREVEQYCQLDDLAQNLLNEVMQKLHFSARVYHRIVKVARTIADLADSGIILPQHISEAFGYRCLDKMKKLIQEDRGYS